MIVLAVSDLSDLDFNATPSSRSCEDKIASRSLLPGQPFSGASSFNSYRNVRARAVPGYGYAQTSDDAVAINTVIEQDPANQRSPSCEGVVEAKSGMDCTELTESVSYSELFGAFPAPDALCLEDWQRYVIMVNSTLLSSDSVVDHRFFVNSNGYKQKIRTSEIASADDWLREGLPAVRKGVPFHSTYWGFTYFSLPALLETTNCEPDPDSVNGCSVHVTLYYTNDKRWHPFASEEVELEFRVAGQPFRPYRQTEFSNLGPITSWYTGGIAVKFEVAASLYSFSLAQFGTFLVSYRNYLLVAAKILTFLLLFGNYIPGYHFIMKVLFHGLRRAIKEGQSTDPRTSHHWYRSHVIRNNHDADGQYITSLRFSAKEQVRRQLGLSRSNVDDITLEIQSVAENSLIADWNASQELVLSNLKHTAQTVLTGDVLLHVNGYTNETPIKALRALESNGAIELAIRHTSAAQMDKAVDGHKLLIHSLTAPAPSMHASMQIIDAPAEADVPGMVSTG